MRPSSVLSLALISLLASGGGGLALARKAGAAPSAAVRVSANARVAPSSAPLRGPGVPGLAVDPSDPNHIVEVDEDFISGQCQYHVSFDAGRSWAGGRLSAPAGFESPTCHQFDIGGYAHSDASVAFGSDQDVYTTFSSQRGTSDQSVIVARSSDGGRSFQPGVVAMDGPTDGAVVYQRPELAVGGSGPGQHVYVDAWLGTVLGPSTGFGSSASKIPGCGQPCGYQIVVASSADRGATWSSPVAATAQVRPGQPADAAPLGIAREQSQPAVGADGEVYLAWRSLVSVKPDEDYLVVARSADGGATWTRVVVGGAGHPIFGLRSPKLAVGPGRAVYVAYQEKAAAGPDIRVVGSADGALTWSPPSRAVDQAVAGQAGVPQLAVAADGRVDVVWYDSRNSTSSAESLDDVYESSSTDQARTFAADRRVTDRSINFDTGLYNRVLTKSFYTPAISSLDNQTLVAWTDSRLGNFTNDNQDVYLATVDLAAGPGIPQTGLKVGSISASTPAGLSVTLSRLAYPGGAEAVGQKPRRSATKVVIVNQDDPADALAAGVLARANFGPVLLSGPSGLAPQVRDEVARIAPLGAYLVGTTAMLGAGVQRDLAAAGVPVKGMARISGPSPAATAAAIATAVAGSRPTGASNGVRGAVTSAVLVNPASADAASASGLAASLGQPVLFVGTDSVPAATSQALRLLGVSRTTVVGGTGSVDDRVLGLLPSAERLAGSDLAGTARAVTVRAVADGIPANLVYVVGDNDEMGAALAGAAAARLGGLVLVASSPAAAAGQLTQLGLAPGTDRIVAVPSIAGGGIPTWSVVVIAVAVVLILAGAVLAVLARRRARSAASAA